MIPFEKAFKKYDVYTPCNNYFSSLTKSAYIKHIETCLRCTEACVFWANPLLSETQCFPPSKSTILQLLMFGHSVSDFHDDFYLIFVRTPSQREILTGLPQAQFEFAHKYAVETSHNGMTGCMQDQRRWFGFSTTGCREKKMISFVMTFFFKKKRLGVTWACFVRCVEALLVTSVRLHAKRHCPLSESITLIVSTYLSMIDFSDVSITCAHLFTRFLNDEQIFPICIDNKMSKDSQFKKVLLERNRRCNTFINTFISENKHLVDDM